MVKDREWDALCVNIHQSCVYTQCTLSVTLAGFPCINRQTMVCSSRCALSTETTPTESRVENTWYRYKGDKWNRLIQVTTHYRLRNTECGKGRQNTTYHSFVRRSWTGMPCQHKWGPSLCSHSLQSASHLPTCNTQIDATINKSVVLSLSPFPQLL